MHKKSVQCDIIPEKAAPITETTLGILASRRRHLGGERDRYPTAWLDKFGTGAMADDCINKCMPSRGAGGIP